MTATSHEQQRELWNQEHRSPQMVKNMDYETPSSGITLFAEWMTAQGRSLSGLTGVEMGCGKGRNSIWLAEQGAIMTGFDFSEVAVEESRRRATVKKIPFDVLMHDATVTWPWPDESFDFGIDCFASTDIENPEGRAFSRNEFMRVLKPSGILFVYAISNKSSFHKYMLETAPQKERNTYAHPSGKIDKIYDERELRRFYDSFLMKEFRVINKPKGGMFYGKEYDCENFWLIVEKPAAIHLSPGLRNFLNDELQMTSWPSKPKTQLIALNYFAEKFEFEKKYTEKEVNDLLTAFHTFKDPALLRRELYMKRFLDRKKDGSEYWRTK